MASNPKRKPWDQLSPNYQKRLLRKGIGPEQHANPLTQLFEARGKKSAADEKYGRQRRSFIKKYTREYGDITTAFGDEGKFPAVPDAKTFGDLFDHISKTRGKEAIERQQRAEKFYDKGEFDKARHEWENRDTDLPDWMFYYHGAFH